MGVNERKVDHLILLVGGNPVPNAVAAKLLAKRGGTISLIYSEGSSSIAECLRDWLTKADYVLSQTRPINEAQSSSIMQEIERVLTNEHNTKHIGLNYTGGTKAMAVHAFRAVEEWGKSHNIRVDCSYLDARSLQMVFESPNESSYVGGDVKFELDDFVKLHGWKLKHEPRKSAIMPATATAIGNIYAEFSSASDKNPNPYKAWKEAVLYVVFKKDGRWVSFNKNADTELNWPSDPKLEFVAQALKAELKQSEFPMLSVRSATKTLALDTEDFVKWLDGIWLEHRVLAALSQLPKNLLDLCTVNDKQQLYQGVKPNKDNEFDLDAAAIAGFQLFAFSCGTAAGKQAKGELKLKLFECIIRARQLGGDQARAALVCPVDDPDKLQNEVAAQLETGSQGQSRVKVFGGKSLANLETELSTWIQSQIQ